MQPRFVTRNRNHGTEENQGKVDKIIDSQIAAIERAKELGLPIVIVEYEDYGDTNSALKKQLGITGASGTSRRTGMGCLIPGIPFEVR